MTDTKNKCYRIQMKLYDPDGRKVEHDEIILPLPVVFDEAIQVYLAAKFKAVEDGGQL